VEDRRISAKSIAEQMGISRERVGSINHGDLDMRKITKWGLFFHDNAPAHRALATQKKLAYQSLDHPSYSPDLAPSDYPLVSGLKKQLKGCYFSSDAEVIAAAETWLDGQHSDFFLVF
jgi:hypothetical protein